MRWKFRFAPAVALLATTVATPTLARTDVVASAIELRVLLVGNSFSRGVRKPLLVAFRARGMPVRFKTVARAGWTLARHAGSAATRRKIETGGWDYVFLQEQSGWISGSRYDDARALSELATLVGASTGFLMTARDRGDPIESYDSLRGRPGGSYGYVPIALELDAVIAPVGWAIRNSLFDGLPLDLWQDGHHLNLAGKYLAACVCFASLTATSPIGLPFPRKLSEADAAYLQRLAETTVLSEADLWNIPAY